jgi:hypothetical protein
MSRISQIYDNFLALTAGQLPNHKQIPDPYNVDENMERILEQGFGIGFGPGTNTARLIGCKLSRQVELNLIITRIMSTTRHDLTTLGNIQKALHEDLFLVEKELYKNDPQLGNIVAKSELLGWVELEPLEGERFKYIRLGSSFLFEYFEEI